MQYYEDEPAILSRSQVRLVWKQDPTWADLLQQLFDWDDQDWYKTPYLRKFWDGLE